MEGPEVKHVEKDTNLLNLHLCPKCERDKVQPVDWDEHDEKHWEITLRCPDCEHWQSVVAPQSDCDLYDDVLETGSDALTRDYHRLKAANMSEDIALFVKAMEADQIWPEDF
jgi:hypothetical protein